MRAEGTFHCMVSGPPARPGHLRPSRHGLEVTCEGHQPRTLSWDEAQISVGGEDDAYVYVRAGELTAWTNAPGFLDALAAIVHPKIGPQLAQIADVRKAGRRWGRVAAVAFVAVLVGLLALLGSVPWLLARSAWVLPRSLDAALGEGALESATGGLGPPLSSPEITACVEAPVQRLLAAAEDAEGYEFVVEVRESAEVNAFALPGGHIVVLTGLLETAADPDEALGVLAHEIAHVTHRDGLRAAARSAGWAIALQLFLGDDGGALIGMAGNVASLVGENAYSRDAEADADRAGAETMARAGYDPLGLARFFERLSGVAGTEMPHALAWLSTHPEHVERVRAVRELAPHLTVAPRPADGCDWAALQASLP